MEQQLDFDEKEQAFVLMRSLDAMRKEKKECDLVIKVGREELPVHRNVMRAQSDYIDAMLSHPTLENQSGVLEMKGVRFEPVKKCVDFFYTGKISTSDEKCEELLYTAALMLIQPVCHKIAQFLQSRLNPKSFFNIKKIATKFVLENLKKVCDVFALENLNLLVKEDEFDDLDLEDLTFLVESTKSCACGMRDDNSRLAMVLRWIKADFENRCDHLYSLMNHIDLSKIYPGSVSYIFENETQFHQCGEFMRMLPLFGSVRSDLRSQPLEVNFSYPNAIIVADYYSQCLQAYNPETNSWTKMHSFIGILFSGSGFYTLGTLENSIYFLSGRKAYRLNIMEKGSSWVPVEDMLKDHGCNLISASHGGFIYVVGADSMERYCPRGPGDEWEEIDCNGIQIDSCGIVTYDDHIYCIGGSSDRNLNCVNKFLPSSSAWSPVAPMRIARRFPAVCVHNDKIYVAGGCSGYSALKSVECYDAKSDCWETLPSMNVGRSRFSLCAVGSKLYAVGEGEGCQEGEEGQPCIIESYDPESDSWSMVPRQPDMNFIVGATAALYLPEQL